MRREEAKPFGGWQQPGVVEISWETGEAFEVDVNATRKLQPSTLITYFPALVNDSVAAHGIPARPT